MHIYGPDPDDEIPENWYADYFPKGKWVYSHSGVLWKTARVLKDESCIKIPDNSRYLVEQVYNDCTLEIPATLVKSSNKAKSKDNKSKATASGNLFPLYRGFVCPGDANPWPDSKAPTRLSEDTETYRLCVMEDEKLKPLVDDPGHPWPMSEIKFCEVKMCYDTKMEQLIKKTNSGLYDKGRGGALLPMVVLESKESSVVIYRSFGCNEKGKYLLYDEKIGLRWEAR